MTTINTHDRLCDGRAVEALPDGTPTAQTTDVSGRVVTATDPAADTDQPPALASPAAPAPPAKQAAPFVTPLVPWLRDIWVVGIDTETTGLSPLRDRIVQLGAVAYLNGQRVAAFRSLINPQMPIPEAVSRVHGFNDASVKDAPLFGEALEAMVKTLDVPAGQPVVFVGHNSDFDRLMLLAEMVRVGASRPIVGLFDPCPVNHDRHWLCTYALAKALKRANKWAKGFRLIELCNKVGIPLDWTTHDALEDAEAAVQLLHVMSKWLPEDLDTVHAVQYRWLQENG
jgi:DNA polymerase-3 subunit epsilon